MAVEAVVSVVIQKFTDLLMQDLSTIFKKVKDEVEDVRTMLTEMQCFLKDAQAQYQEESSDENDEFVKWATNFLETVYRVDYVIETFALSRIRLRRLGFIKRNAIMIKNEFSSCRSLPKEMDDNISTMVALKRNMDSIKKSIEKCKGNKPHLKLVTQFQRSTSARGSSTRVDEVRHLNPLQRTHLDLVPDLRRARSASESSSQEKGRPFALTRTYTYNVDQEESMIFDFKKDVKMLVTFLTDKEKQQSIISVIGEGESDKSLLVKTIYEKRKIKEHFQARALVSIPRNYDIRHLLLLILRQVMSIIPLNEEENYLSTDILKGMLYECLKDKTYLIVMDDLWAPEVFEEIKGSLPDMFNGSRVMFTTSDEDVASFADQQKRHRLELDDEECWNLFLKKVPVLAHDPFLNQFMIDLKKKVVTICKRVPLRILMLGGLLSTKKAIYEEWRRVLDQYQNCQPPSSVSRTSDVLTFFYNDLPPHLKLCFLYIGLFPKGFEIPVRRLFRLWLAEGFVKGSAVIIPEDLVGGYLEELVNRNIVEISKRRSDGSIKKCRMLGVFHEVFLSKAVDIGLFHIHQRSAAPTPRFAVRRVVDYFDIKHYPSSEFYLQNLQSYLSFNLQNKDIPAVEIGIFLGRIIHTRGFGLLRVLDLERVYKPSLPEKLGNLFHLRYLGLRWTFLDTLPSSVGDLLYLETLDIKHTYITTLPHSIGKMKHLRHLCLNETHLDISAHRLGSSSLTQLQTLWGLYVDEKSQRKNGLSNLRKLGLTSHSSCFEELVVWISTLSSLQSLRLRSKDKVGRPSDLQLPPLESLMNLSHLYLLGKLVTLPPRSDFPPGLRVLTLSVSQLEDDPMPTLAQLPNLAVLRLLAGSYTGQEMNCPPQGFPSLLVLKIWKLKRLEKWTVQEGAMQNLRALEIRCCEKLKEIPYNLLQLSAFEKLILTNMPDGFVKRTQLKRHKHTNIKVNTWVF